MAGTFQPQEVHTGATNSNRDSAVQPNNSTPPVVVATNTDGALPNAADSTQGYVTMANLTAFSDRKRSKHGTIPFQFICDPPCPKEILSRPSPKKYESLAFLQYNGRKGSAVEHVNKFIDDMGAHTDDRDLCLHEFSKSFSNKAYTWYTTLPLASAHREPNDDDKCNSKYCRYHRFVHHVTMDYFSLRRMYHRRVLERLLEAPNRRQRVDKDILPHHNQGAINVPTHVESIRLGFIIDARRRAIEAILSIANKAGGECLNAEAHASHACHESSNAVTFINEDMEAPYPDHRKPLYLSAQINSVNVKRALINIESFLNLIPLSTIIAGHFDVLRKVLDRCRLYKLKMNLVKCAFSISAGKFLGFLVSKHGISMDLAKSEVIYAMQPPKNLKQLHSFISKDLMLRLLTISVPIQGRPLKVDLFTSDKTVSALVAQDNHEGKEQLVYYVSKNLKGVESRAKAGVVLKDDNGHDIVLSFKLDFQCTNNTVEYKAYLISLIMVKKAGVQRFKIIGDSGLILGQVQGTFAVREEQLTPYCSFSQHLEQSFASIRYEQIIRKEQPIYPGYESVLLELPDHLDWHYTITSLAESWPSSAIRRLITNLGKFMIALVVTIAVVAIPSDHRVVTVTGFTLIIPICANSLSIFGSQ
ncbi:hypothetical protein SLEP1_g26095 [Rubroshorea leprosula]|uniref:RNase H type-1 domain-containing protein n=1 Tax=Rubroshorea leprosula TaxID=152421 RepID=A0AAV5JVA3_9ROSI|nr:hypothetical protein SLEP1_g26095 [Rubroshorea leprosula]